MRSEKVDDLIAKAELHLASGSPRARFRARVSHGTAASSSAELPSTRAELQAYLRAKRPAQPKRSAALATGLMRRIRRMAFAAVKKSGAKQITAGRREMYEARCAFLAKALAAHTNAGGDVEAWFNQEKQS